MPDNTLEALLRRLLPDAVRRELFDPARFDLHTDRFAAGKGALWHRWQLIRLYAECWRVSFIPEFPSRPTERTGMFVNDLRFALRSCRREPGFNLLAMLTLALGIGAMTMMYSVIYNVLLNPFPYTDPRRMVDVVFRNSADGGIRGALTVTEFRALVDESRVFEDAVGASDSRMLYRSENGVEQFNVVALTPNTFRFLGVPALLGRAFAEEDAIPGAPRVAVLSHRAWITYFGGDPGILGRTIALSSTPMTVIGVMPPRFTWNVADVWMPDPADRRDPDQMKRFWLQGRLKNGTSQAQAEAELNVIGRRLAQLYPDRYPKRFTISIITVIDWVVGRFRGVLYTLFGAVGLLLLIACCNVANMLLARATIRARAHAIRTALGATRFRILQQSFAESLLLAIGGGAFGVAFAYAGLAALKPFIPPYGIAKETVIEINPSVLLFSLAVATLTALIFGVLPAVRATRRDIAVGLSASGKGAEVSARHGGFRKALVVCEVTLSLVLLSGAGVLMQSFLSLIGQNLGFDPHNLVATRMNLLNATPAEQQQFLRAALDRVRSLPGVTAAGITTNGLPPYGGDGTNFDIPGKAHTEIWRGEVESCDETYFQTVGFRLLAGSLFSPADIASGRQVAVVNETLRNRFFGSEDPLGRQIRLERLAAGPGGNAAATFQIIGVVQDIRNRGLEEPIAPEAFIPYTRSLGFPRILIRTAIDSHLVAKTVRREIRAVNSNVVQRDPLVVEDTLAQESYARPRFSVLLMAVFGALGLLLVATGVYGVMTYVVSRQIREIGIRMALGAERGQVFGWVFGGAFRLIGLGTLVGGVASIATNRIIATQVWAVRMFDPIALGAAVALIAILGGVACFHPAFRATRVDPVVSLREE
ncbi:MAG TPA: ABC transporter permease [Bryobacteraceae bacterium]